MAPASAERQWKRRVNPWVIAAKVALAAFIEVLDTSVANVAQPHIAGNLGASTDEGAWVLPAIWYVMGRKRFFSCASPSSRLPVSFAALAPHLIWIEWLVVKLDNASLSVRT